MGKLIKNHWARLVVLAAASYQFAAAVHGFFWPKFFWDWLTKNFDPAVKPIPVLQTINLIIAIITLCYEWPVKFLAGTTIQKSLEARLIWLPLACLSCALLYQATDPALYYLVAIVVYFWAYSEGEVICAVPWTLPKRSDRKRLEKV